MVRQNAPCEIWSLWRRTASPRFFIYFGMLSRYRDLFQPMVLARGSCCKHSQGHRYIWVHIIHIPKNMKGPMIWHMYLCEFKYTYLYICTKKVRCVSTRECRDKCELAVHGSNHNVSVVWQTDICEDTSVFKEPQSVSARMDTDGCEFAQHGFVYNVSMIPVVPHKTVAEISKIRHP
jgi:hypothetical protein